MIDQRPAPLSVLPFINAGLADQLPEDGAQVRVLAARKFITACEVIA